MGKTKLLVLTKVEMQPNEIGQKKIDDAVAKKKEEDEDGLNERLESMGITPRNRGKSEINVHGEMFLEPEEMEEVLLDMIIDLNSFDTCEDDTEGSYVTLKNRREFAVLEDSNDIYAQIYMLNQSWWEKLRDRIRLIFTKAPKDGNN